MPTTVAASSVIAISAGVPATQTIAGFAALTYTVIGEIEKIGPSGQVFEKVSFQPLNGSVQKHKGPSDLGTLAPTMGFDNADAGQVLLRTAGAHQTAQYCFRITRPDATVKYLQGRVFGFTETIDGANSIIMGSCTVEINAIPTT